MYCRCHCYCIDYGHAWGPSPPGSQYRPPPHPSPPPPSTPHLGMQSSVPSVLLQLCCEEEYEPRGPCQSYTEAHDILRDLQANLQADKSLLMQVLASVWRKVIAHCTTTLHHAHCTMHTILCTLYYAACTVYHAHCITLAPLYSAYDTMPSILDYAHVALHMVLCTRYFAHGAIQHELASV